MNVVTEALNEVLDTYHNYGDLHKSHVEILYKVLTSTLPSKGNSARGEKVTPIFLYSNSVKITIWYNIRESSADTTSVPNSWR